MDLLNEETYRKLFYYDEPKKLPFIKKLKTTIKCDKQIIFNIFPILKWLPKYKKTDLVSDIIAGLTVGVMHIPQGMAYALLGGVPPVVGIYTAFFPVLIYIFMGTSHHVSMGTFAVVSMMVGKSVDEYAFVPETNSTIYYLEEPSKLTPIDVASALCLVVGFWQLALSFLRLGSLSVLLSQTLVSGFTAGAAVHVLTSQIKNLLGIKAQRYSGSFQILYRYVDILSNLSTANVTSVILSLSFIMLLVTFNEFVKPFMQKKLKKNIQFPIELLVVILGTLLSMFLKLKENYGVVIVEYVPKGLPYPTVPHLNILPNLLTDGLIIAIVAVCINISMASIFAQKKGYEIDGNQEILASGVGNIFSSFFSCMPYAVSLSRSLVQVTAGGVTQITSAISAFSLVFVLLFIGPYFEPLPYCVLSTIIVVALKGMFVQIKEVPGIFKTCKLEGLVWVSTFLSVIIFDISYGLGVGLIASAGSLLYKCKKFQIISLGSIPNTKTYLDLNRYKKSQIVNNVIILRVVGGIHFANSNDVKTSLLKTYINMYKNMSLTFANEEKLKKNRPMVLDLSRVPFIDSSAIKCFKSLKQDLKIYKSDILLCGCNPGIYSTMEKSNLFIDIPKSFIFHDLHDAVEYGKILEKKFDEIGEFIIKF